MGTAVSTVGGYLDLLFTTQGTASGSYTGNMPIAYTFTITDSTSAQINWDVYFSAAGIPNVVSNSADGVSTGGTITGSLNVPLDGSNLYEYVLHLDVYEGDSAIGDSFTVNIPDDSIDVNPVPSFASTPEPATLGLFGFALTTLGSLTWFRREHK
jgi:hypothetical protein